MCYNKDGDNMKKLLIIIIVTILFLIIYPFVEIDIGNKIIKFQYNYDISEFEEITCYDDGYSYNKKRNISITQINFKKFLFFHKITFEYKKGNICNTEFYLDESYIKDFILNAKIEYNDKNIDIKELIKDKEAITGNKRYSGNDYDTSIEYILNGKYEIMYIFYVDDLLVIQVGLSDEGPKFIAYK